MIYLDDRELEMNLPLALKVSWQCRVLLQSPFIMDLCPMYMYAHTGKGITDNEGGLF